MHIMVKVFAKELAFASCSIHTECDATFAEVEFFLLNSIGSMFILFCCFILKECYIYLYIS